MSLSRREFLVSAAAAALPRQAARILDVHTHFYDPTRPQGVPWPPKNDPILYRKVLPADFAAVAKPCGVAATVVLEASPWVEDNQWILDLHKDQPLLAGLVGNLAPESPDFEANLKRFAANPAFRGIRIGAAAARKSPDALKLLADRDLALDVNGGPDVLPAVDALAAKFPPLRIVINHCANLKIDGKEPPAAWTKGMRDCAARKNVYAKVSGLVEGTGKNDGSAPADAAFYTQVLDVLWSAFGEDRLVWGSNWPVSARFAPYGRVFGIVEAYFKDKRAADKVLGLNAKAAYKPIG
jgi:predicted TIM-barrel fold metal-dependent hydrolase